MTPKRPEGGWPWEGRPGFFTELMREHDWPPGFKPTQLGFRELDDFTRSRTAAAARDVQLSNGHTGSIANMSRKANERLEATRDAAIRRAKKP
jgi:hypothetical protein